MFFSPPFPFSTFFSMVPSNYTFLWVTCNLGNCHAEDQSSQSKNSTDGFWKAALSHNSALPLLCGVLVSPSLPLGILSPHLAFPISLQSSIL